MTARHINPIVKLVLEVGPIAVFFLAYRMAPLPEGLDESERQLQQILFSTAVFVPYRITRASTTTAQSAGSAEPGTRQS